MPMASAHIPPRDFPHSREFPHRSGPFPHEDARPKDGAFAALDLGREASLARLETLAHLMDTAFVIPGINRRVGFDALIGLVPLVGDVAGMVISSFIVFEARRLGAPRWLIGRMALNVAFDGVVGAVPVAGDIFDAAFKANRRNVRLLRRWMERNGGLRPNEIEGTAVRLSE